MIDLLHTAHGHLEMQFKTPEQAGEEITSLMRRGFILIVTINGEDHKVSSFDSKTGEYIVRETRKVWAATKEVEERVGYKEADAKAIAPEFVPLTPLDPPPHLRPKAVATTEIPVPVPKQPPMIGTPEELTALEHIIETPITFGPSVLATPEQLEKLKLKVIAENPTITGVGVITPPRTAAPDEWLAGSVPSAAPKPMEPEPPPKEKTVTVETRVPYKEAKVTAVAPIAGG